MQCNQRTNHSMSTLNPKQLDVVASVEKVCAPNNNWHYTAKTCISFMFGEKSMPSYSLNIRNEDCTALIMH
jgi:C1A family cysteine protease